MNQQRWNKITQELQQWDRATAYQRVSAVALESPTWAPAWIELSKLVDDPKKQREYLECALALDPTNRIARHELEQIRAKELVITVTAFAQLPSPPPQKLGEFLVGLGIITPEQLQEALVEQKALKRVGEPMPLGELLLHRGWLTPELLAQTLVQQQLQYPVELEEARLGEYLVAQQLITSEQLMDALARQLQYRLEGEHVLLGQILVERRYLSLLMLEKVLMRQSIQYLNRFEV